MSKIHYFRDKFSKIAKRGDSPPPVLLYLRFLETWSWVIWPNCGFSN